MMKETCYAILAHTILLVMICQKPSPAKATLTTDQNALLALKTHITLDPQGILTTNWSNSSTSAVCSWIGVTCGKRHQRVTSLNISDMNLSGTIPPQIGNLTFLVSLDLSYNLFNGTLPQELSQLHRLKVVSLRVNNFGGDIPSWFGLIPNLEHLSLRNNSFTGFIPISLFNLSNLQVLDFASNSLQGDIPAEIGRLRNLRLLSMEYNRLSGDIPSTIFNLTALENMVFIGNELSGSLPIDMCANLPLIQRINLYDNQMSGEIPSNLSGCSQLQFLTLTINFFSGPIPREIGSLRSLRSLALGYNNLNGVIPQEIGNLQNLAVFGIERNRISGAVPLNIFNISSLQRLVLSNNRLTGSLPRDIGNLTMLRELSILTNNFAGVLPQEIGQLDQLEEISVGNNSFTGIIPPEIFNISTLQILQVTINGFSGDLPTDPCRGLPNLEYLFLSDNNFSGSIPESISNCSQLRILSLGANRFTGVVPRSLGNLRFLEVLDLLRNNLRIESSELSFITSLTNCRFLNYLTIDYNLFDGVLPPSIGNFSDSFESFYAFNCGIKGSIPPEIGNVSNLVALSLPRNELSGSIPHTIEQLDKLQGLFLHTNNMEGPIPVGVCNLGNLVEIHLSRNRFSGAIPECLGNVTSLQRVYLQTNMLDSSIPPSIWRIQDVLELDLSSNSLSGILPPEMGNLVRASYINLSMNQLSGNIPDTIGTLQDLATFSMANNRLQGSIPVSVGSMISLVTLDFSYNNLSGPIPKSLEALQHLENFNVSFNDLSGEIPIDGPFRNFTMESFMSNEALCGIPRFHVPICKIVSRNRSKMKRVRLALFILCGVIAFIVLFALAFIFIRYRMRDKMSGRIDGMVSTLPERFSYYELSQATEQFSESYLLGIGSFGSVYKAVLGDGKVLAVKVFNLQSEAVFKSFDVECEVLRNIRHRNLTKVISSCSNEDFRALVLEYMPNGSLEKWLYSYNYCLDLGQRLNIMIDVASALEYLHHGYSTPIVHCDLKPSNVLLDEDMIAHVSDFGIAKLLGDGESIVYTNTLATFGYIAPEFGLEGLVSTRCDVYSYGVMLMEVFTRKRPSDDMFVGDLSLRSWVESESSSQVIDANLLNLKESDLINPKEEHFKENLQCVSSILELALKCSVESSRDRINMKEALAELHRIKARFIR